MNLNNLIGTVFAERFELLAIAGSGGMGTVFKAKQLGLERIVALKILSPNLLSDNESVKRFEREAVSLSRIAHPNIATFFSFGIEDNLPYIVMEYVEGESLRSILAKEERLDWQRSYKICRQVCEAMSFAHSAGMVHRDLKPNNIMLLASDEAPGGKSAPDSVKVVDFGLAKLTIASGKDLETLTETGMLVGSVHYMSPEQCRGKVADARADIYSLGCILYEMLTGTPPFDADNPVGIIHKHVNENLDLSHLRQRNGVEHVLAKAMEKDIDRRYQSMDDMAADLRHVDQGELSKLTQAKPQGAGLQATKRSLPVTISLWAALLLLLGTAWILFTDDGVCFQQRVSMIGKSMDRKKIMHWLQVMDRMEVNGDFAAAHNIKAGLMSGLHSKTGELALIKAELALGQNSLRNGDRAQAGRWSLRLISDISQTVSKTSRLDKPAYLVEKQNLLSDACELVITSGAKTSKTMNEQVNYMLTQPTGNARVSLLQLECKAAAESGYRHLDRKFASDMVDMIGHLGDEMQSQRMLALAPYIIVGVGKLSGNESADTASVNLNLACRLANCGKTRESKQFLRRGLAILPFLPNAIQTGDLWKLAAQSYRILGDYSNSMLCAKHALSVFEQLHDDGEAYDGALSEVFENLVGTKKLDEAVSLLEHRLASSSEIDHFSKRYYLATLSNLKLMLGKPTEAKITAQRLLDELDSDADSQNEYWHYTEALSMLALAQGSCGESEEAQVNWKTVLKRMKSHSPAEVSPYDGMYNDALNRLCTYLSTVHKLSEIESVLQDRMKFLESKSTRNSEELTVVRSFMGKTYLEQNRLAEAESLYKRALDEAKQTAIPDQMFPVYQDLATICQTQNRPAEAEKYWRQAIYYYFKSGKAAVPDYGWWQLADALATQKKFAEAQKVMEDLLPAIPDNAPEHKADIHGKIAEIFLLQKKYGDAKKQLLLSLEIRRQGTTAAESEKYAHTCLCLADACEQLGELAESESYRKEMVSALQKQQASAEPGYLALAEFQQRQKNYSESQVNFKNALADTAYLATHPLDQYRILAGIASNYAAMHDYAAAETYWEEALDVSYKKGDQNGYDTHSAAFFNLAIAQRAQNKFNDALKNTQTWLSEAKKIRGENSQEVCDISKYLAENYRLVDNYSEAEKLDREALQVAMKLNDKEKRRANTVRTALALDIEMQKRYTDAEAAWKDAAKCWGQSKDKDAPLCVKEALAHLESCFQMQHKFAEALEVEKQQYDNAIKKDAKSDEVVISLRTMGGISREQHKYLQAESYFKQALELGAKTKGANTPLCARVLHPLAYCRLMEGKERDFETLRRKELQILDKFPEEDEGWMYRDALRSLGELLIEQRRYTESMPLLKHRYAIIQKLQKTRLKFEMSRCLMQIADVEKELGHYAEADKQYRLALQAAKLEEGENSPDCGAALSKLADNFKRQKDKKSAADNFARANKILQSALNEKDKSPEKCEYEYRDIYSRLAENCQLQGNYKGAEEYWKKSLPYWSEWEQFDKGYGYRQALSNLDKCSKSLNKPDESAEWKRKLQEFHIDRT